ncbi:hypothetical protein FOZ63_032160 [Perkinsus olseni]|uniref:Uncharacterized protein n=1 Tax=Perkinsus olseni TaxID=32597 RepID=A0A7J6S5F9_PEROL|nr:hypothetical protein FOZ63_032160 [Perkinsus olseni]
MQRLVAGDSDSESGAEAAIRSMKRSEAHSSHDDEGMMPKNGHPRDALPSPTVGMATSAVDLRKVSSRLRELLDKVENDDGDRESHRESEDTARDNAKRRGFVEDLHSQAERRGEATKEILNSMARGYEDDSTTNFARPSRSSSMSSDALGDVTAYADLADSVDEYTLESGSALNRLRRSVVKARDDLTQRTRGYSASPRADDGAGKSDYILYTMNWERHGALKEDIGELENELSTLDEAVRRVCVLAAEKKEQKNREFDSTRQATVEAEKCHHDADDAPAALIESVREQVTLKTLERELMRITSHRAAISAEDGLSHPHDNPAALASRVENALQSEVDTLKETLEALEQEIAAADEGCTLSPHLGGEVQQRFTREGIEEATRAANAEAKTLRVELAHKNNLVNVAGGILRILDERMDLLAPLHEALRGAAGTTYDEVSTGVEGSALQKSGQGGLQETSLSDGEPESHSVMLMERLLAAEDNLGKLVEEREALLVTLKQATEELDNARTVDLGEPESGEEEVPPEMDNQEDASVVAAEVKELRRTLECYRQDIGELRNEWHEAKARDERSQLGNSIPRVKTIEFEDAQVAPKA